MTTIHQAESAPTTTPANSTNTYARAALAFGIVGAVGLSIILGVTALVQKESRDEGRGVAIAALAISGVWIALFFALTRWHLG